LIEKGKRMINKQKILIVDDDENIAELISLYLAKEMYDTRIAGDGLSALEQFKSYEPDLVLLDIMLPAKDGYQVCREIRNFSQVPIIMLSAKGEVFDKVLGLELGADDYMEKPFDSKELVARCKAILRRYHNGKEADKNEEEIRQVSFTDLSINITDYTVVCRGERIDMAPKELELLYFLASSPNRVFSREQLLDRIWGYDYVGDTRTVDVHIKRIREKLGEHEKWSVSAIWGVGYKFEDL